MADTANMVDVGISSSVDLTSMISRRLIDSERRVFNKHRDTVIIVIKDKWVGWVYDGRPEAAPRNVSQEAWKSRISTSEAKAELILTNKATAFRASRRKRKEGESQSYVKTKKHYAAYVHRAGGTEREWKVIQKMLVADYLPKMIADLIEEVKKNVFVPGKVKKLRGTRETVQQRAALE